MMPRLGAASVHVLTASGAVLALLALRAVHQSDWQMMFVWLGAALIVDAVDGPLARRLSVATVLAAFQRRTARPDRRLPHLCGGPRLCADRSAAVAGSRAPAGGGGHPVVEPVPRRRFEQQDGRRAISSASRRSGTSSCSICSRSISRRSSRWPSSPSSFFSPSCRILAVHPFRVERLRALTCLVAAVWAAAAATAIANPFPSPPWIDALLIATAIYFAGIGLYRWLVLPDQGR